MVWYGMGAPENNSLASPAIAEVDQLGATRFSAHQARRAWRQIRTLGRLPGQKSMLTGREVHSNKADSSGACDFIH